ncbi:MAG: Wzz/FepE/Etk N-terminal domain-containing protein [Terracidiphilus sp.]
MQSLPGSTAGILVHESSSLRPIVAAGFRYRRLWFLIVLGVAAITAIYVLLVPRRYQSEMDILVQNKRGDEQITPSRINGEITVNNVTEEQINSEIQILTSRGLANQVVDPNWSSESKAKMTREQLKAHDKAVQEFEKHLSVAMVRKSNVIHVAFVAPDPKVAADTLNRLLAAFLKKQQDIAQPPGTAQFFSDQAAHYKQQLDQAQQQLAEYQQQNKIVSLSDSEDTLNREINDAQTDLRATDAQIGALSQQLSSQTQHLTTIPARQMTEVRTIPNDYSIERLNTMLADLENQRTSLLTKFTSNDRLVQQIDKQIADTKSALANAQRMTSQEHDSDINPVWQTVTGSIIQNETEREALKAKHAVLANQVGTLQGQLSNIEGSTVTFNTLRQKVADLQNNYQLYTQKRDEATIADAMNASRLLNVAVAQNPTYSLTPYRPKPLLDTVLGTFTAVFFATFLVFFAEIGRNTFSSSREVETILRFPVLADVPLVYVGNRTERHLEFVPAISGMASAEVTTDVERDPWQGLVQTRKEARG